MRRLCTRRCRGLAVGIIDHPDPYESTPFVPCVQVGLDVFALVAFVAHPAVHRAWRLRCWMTSCPSRSTRPLSSECSGSCSNTSRTGIGTVGSVSPWGPIRAAGLTNLAFINRRPAIQETTGPTCTRTRAHAHAHAHTHLHMHTHMHTRKLALTNAHIHTCLHKCLRSQKQLRAHTQSITRVYAYTHAHSSVPDFEAMGCRY